MSVTDKTLKLRFIKVTFVNGAREVLATSLLDSQAFAAEECKSLQHACWNIGDGLHSVKHRLLVDALSGELPASIQQDFRAKLLTAKIAEALACSALQHVSSSQMLMLIEYYARILQLKWPARQAPRSNSRLNPKPRQRCAFALPWQHCTDAGSYPPGLQHFAAHATIGCTETLQHRGTSDRK